MIFKTKGGNYISFNQHFCLLKSRLKSWTFKIVEISQGFKINIDLLK
jgi:hypothetical protein